jgi:hypothetical protein
LFAFLSVSLTTVKLSSFRISRTTILQLSVTDIDCYNLLGLPSVTTFAWSESGHREVLSHLRRSMAKGEPRTSRLGITWTIWSRRSVDCRDVFKHLTIPRVQPSLYGINIVYYQIITLMLSRLT